MQKCPYKVLCLKSSYNIIIMDFALTIFCVLLFCCYKNFSYNKASNKYITYISIALVLFSGLRHETVGNDTINYINMFDSVKFESWDNLSFDFMSRYFNQSSNQEKDPGYPVFVKLTQFLIYDARTYLFLVAILYFTSLGIFVKKHTSSLQEILFFYVFYINLFNGYVPNSAVRQTIAISFVLFAYTNLRKQNYKYYFALIFIASFFHKSALICLLVYPLSYIKSIDKVYYMGLPLFLLVLTSVDRFASLFLTGNDVYNGYLSDNYYGDTDKPIIVLILMSGLYLIGFFGVRKDKSLKDCNLFYIGSIFSLLFSSLIWVNPSLIRLMTYFGPLMGIAVGTSLNRMKNGRTILIAIIFIFLVSSTRNIGNYHFMWETEVKN